MEKYFDETYQRPYFYDPKTGDSLWEAPPNAIVADMTLALNNQVKVQQEKPLSKEELKRKQAEEKRREEYQKKQAEIKRLQMENMQAMYPEYYQQNSAA